MSDSTVTKKDTTEKTDLKSLTREELADFCSELDLQSFRGDQIYKWLYEKGVSGFEEMTNLSKDLRSRLEEIAEVNRIELVRRQESSDGTIKFLFEIKGGYHMESVLIPDFDDDGYAKRLTVCVSSQVGCVFGCSFCATGKMGHFRNLSHGEIVDQVQYLDEVAREKFDKGVTNIVYMGMGEPLHNYDAVMESTAIISDPETLNISPKRITVSTVGLTKQIKQLADERQPFNLAVSLHAADDEKRDEIMPINKSLNLENLKDALTHYFERLHKPVTFEYLLFNQFNDTPEDAEKLSTIAHWIPSKVNIIMYNNVEGVELKRAQESRLDQFLSILTDNDVTATVRRSRGEDIDAGCGQLAVKEGEKGKSIAD